MNCETVIAGAIAVLPSGREFVDIGIADGQIAIVGEPGSVRADRKIDAKGLIALPAGVDMHVHFREPGMRHKEDFAHGTAAAACGGITAVCDMPNTIPPVTTAQALSDKLAVVSRSAHVDFGLWAGGTATEEFASMKRLGAVGLKVYMNRAKPGSHSYSSDLSMPDDNTFKAVLEKAAEIDWQVCVHVQSPDIDEEHVRVTKANGNRSPRDVCDMARTPESAEAQRRVLALAKATGARVHIAHISFNSMRALADFKVARRQGSRVTTEIAPPCLTHADLERVGPLGIPFAHSEEENEAYWLALRDGTIDAVATDHAPHSLDEKMGVEGDAWTAASGYPAVETMMPLLVNATMEGKITLERLVQVCSAAPARICGFGKKGAIAEGMDADFVLVDPEANWSIDQRHLHSKAGWSPFNGRRLRGRISSVYLRGVEISRDGELIDGPRQGRNIGQPMQ